MHYDLKDPLDNFNTAEVEQEIRDFVHKCKKDMHDNMKLGLHATTRNQQPPIRVLKQITISPSTTTITP
jgi:hypothetical protein